MREARGVWRVASGSVFLVRAYGPWRCSRRCSVNQLQRIAPAVPSRQSSIGARAESSPGPGATFNHPERPYSLPAGRRSLMGGCAAWRQTRAQGVANALHRNRAIRSTRHFIQLQMGTDTALGRRLGVCRLALAVGESRGIGERSTALHTIKHHRHQGRFQRIAKGHPRHFKASIRYVHQRSQEAFQNAGNFNQQGRD